MSILNCSTRLTIINCTGLPATFTFSPLSQHMRLQPIGQSHINATVGTNASTIREWLQEWVQLISYGPTYSELEWSIDANTEETVRFEVITPMNVQMQWSDPSVSWETHNPGKWTIDVAHAVDVTVYLRAEIGEYVQTKISGRPAQVKSVQLKPYLEIACDDEIPFVQQQRPIANMFWSPQINIEQIINPNRT